MKNTSLTTTNPYTILQINSQCFVKVLHKIPIHTRTQLSRNFCERAIYYLSGIPGGGLDDFTKLYAFF